MKKIQRKTWKNTPKIINKIPNDDTVILFIDESGEGHKTMLNKAFKLKEEKAPFNERNDLYILNGICMTGSEHEKLASNLNKLKKEITPEGLYEYEGKGIRPIILHNHEMAGKLPPFAKLKPSFYEKLNKIIDKTKFTQITAGLNYYSYTLDKDNNIQSSPLLMSLGLIVMNYALYLKEINKKGIIIFEEETAKHDKMKLKYIVKLLYKGNKTLDNKVFSNIKSVYFRKKWTEEKGVEGIEYNTTAGLELADITLSPIRRVLHPEYLLIERKLYNYPNYNKKGLNIIT